MNNEMNKAPTYGDYILSEEYDKRIERRSWFKHHKSKLLWAACSVSAAAIVAISLIFYMI